MSRSRTSRFRRTDVDEGFTLVEVLVALVIFALFSAAALPLVITGLRTGTVAKLDTGAKNLTQERFEKMRNLPYHIPQSTNTGSDLLDRYFPNLLPAAGVDAPGYVSAAAPRAAGEPAGPFYRVIVAASEISPDPATASTFDRYKQRLATQFLNPNGGVLTPIAWDSLSSPADEAVPAQVVRVTARTTWTAGSLSKSYTVSTEIADGRAAPPIARAELKATALRVSSTYRDAAGVVSDLLLEAGGITADGQVARGAKAAGAARGAFASLVPGSRVDGASTGGTAPGDKSVSASTAGVKVLEDPLWAMTTDKTLVRFAESTVEEFDLKSASGQFLAGASTKPIRGAVKAGGELVFTNKPNPADLLLRIRTDLPVVSTLGSGSDVARARGDMASVGGTAPSVRSTATMSTPVLAVMRTEYAPDGLLQLKLTTATVSCGAGTSAVAPTASYTGTFRYWRFDPASGTEGYSADIPLSETAVSDELNNLLVGTATAPGPAVAHMPVTGTPVTYDRYFTALKSASTTSLASERVVAAPRYEANHAALIQVSTVSLRTDVESPVTVALGVSSCRAEDRR